MKKQVSKQPQRGPRQPQQQGTRPYSQPPAAPRPRQRQQQRAGPSSLVPPRSYGREVGDGAMSEVAQAYTRVNRTGAPRMITQRNGDCRIIHREYIQEIVAGSGTPSVFSDTVLPVNPGQVQTFPWLAGVAARFESYRFNRLKFDYETEAPSTLGGTLVLGIDYDASDPAALSKQAAMAWRGSVRSAPWKPCCHTSAQEDLNKQKSYFVRPGVQPPATDVKTYDVGNLNVISQNVTTASSTLGELYVEYDVTLMTPVYEQTASTSGTITMTLPTVAAPFLNGVSLGSIQLSSAAATPTVLNVVGLTIGQEYLLSYSLLPVATTPTFATFVGWNIKSTFSNGDGQASYTLIATSSSASATMTLSGAPGVAGMATVSQIPISAL